MPKTPTSHWWLPACHRNLDLDDPGGYTVLADRYAAAVTQLGLQPVLFPMAEAGDIPCLLPLVDGVLLTGSPSNVEATHFGETALPTDLLDPRRDQLTMRLVREALDRAVPLFGVCRPAGNQRRAGRQPVPEPARTLRDDGPPRAARRGPRRAVRGAARGAAEPAARSRTGPGQRAMVNSLHGQGIRRLGEGLVAEAHAPDGLVEGVRVMGAPAFAYAVQWHPEWRHEQHPFYQRTLEAFAESCRGHRKLRDAE